MGTEADLDFRAADLDSGSIRLGLIPSYTLRWSQSYLLFITSAPCPLLLAAKAAASM